ncbi:MAG: HAD family hydrolase [Desulfobacterales bacterium]|jgi:putative hydrolase of the HAD superfamily|nr:hypothetical protein [Desulfobacter sp.]MDP6681389.1 HAD family hydrolase [Desulfobacterales bacterium]MDP6808851.1 HAD family hydrolase [Desulfobacterales bacterium]|tara:strand:- start:717 stop:1463 length:747 start_codon:yes stop_codon:yes gene_type:complete
MRHVAAIGFDLFNTLIEANAGALNEAMDRLIQSLQKNGLAGDPNAITVSYEQAAVSHIEKAHQSGKETHNRFWICDALNRHGGRLSPDDFRIAEAVDAYFSAFYPNCRLIPGVTEILTDLKGQYHLGLLSNFTHPQAAMTIIDQLNLTPFFETIVISGDVGYRKPHPRIFDRFVDNLKTERGKTLFIGDDLEADVQGAERSGLIPIWITYARDRKLPFTSGKFFSGGELPGNHIPRISAWHELFPLLH